PTAVSVAPSSGSGTSATFTYVYSDPNGASDIGTTLMMLNASLTPANGCFVVFARAANQFYLIDDAGTGALGPVTAGTNASLQNSSCVLDASASASSSGGTTLTVTATLSFKPGFAGAKNNYMLASDSLNQSSGWTINGVFLVQ